MNRLSTLAAVWLAALGFLVSPDSIASVSDESATLDRIDRELSAGQLREAGSLLRELLADNAGLRSAPRGAELHLTLARIEVNLGRYHAGLDAARTALAVYEEQNDPAGQARAHFRIATAFDELARYDESHRHNHRALALYRRLGDRLGEAQCLSMFGTSFRFLGDPTASLRYHDQARRLFAELGQLSMVSFEHRHLGLVLEDLERPGEAEKQYRLALAMLRGQGQLWGEADLLFQLGRLEAREATDDVATPLLEQALALGRKAQNTWVESMALLELARLDADRGKLDGAKIMARRSIRLLDEMGANDLLWQAYAFYASLLEKSGDPAAAESTYLESVRMLESVRSSIGRPMIRSRYTPRTRGVYEALTRLQSHWPADAAPAVRAQNMFETAERSRAQTFTEMLLESQRAPSTSRPPESRPEIELRATIHALRTRLTRFGYLLSDREAVENELFEAEQRHAALLLEMRRRDRRLEETVAAPPPTVDETARILGDAADLIAYQLGEEASFGWHLRRGELLFFELPPRAEIENLVLLFRSLTASRDNPEGLAEVSRQLSRRLLGPVLDDLVPGRTLVLLPDGALFDLPFESLLVDEDSAERYLIQRHTVFYLPSIRVLEQIRRRADQRTPAPAELDLLAFGDPSLEEGTPWPPLRHAGSEIRRIEALFADDRTETRTGAEASERQVRDSAGRPARILHFATHGVLDSAHPERSGLVLADGFLDLYEIFNLELVAELVVLSGCETARGELLRGEGILGLSRAFQFAGTRAVVASLWRVDDRSTEDLMVSFYRKLRAGMPAARALRRTKIEWIESSPEDSFDPFPWAAFVLVGDGDLTVAAGPPVRWIAVAFMLIGFSLIATAAAIARRRRSVAGETGAGNPGAAPI